MILAKVKDRAGWQEGGGAQARGRGRLRLAPWSPPAPRPPEEASCPLTLALEGPRAQDHMPCFPLLP